MSERVDALCTELSLSAVANHYGTLADEAVKKKRSYVEYLELVLEGEAALRSACSREMMVRLATFPTIKTLDQFDFDAAACVPKNRVHELSGLAFVRDRPNGVTHDRVNGATCEGHLRGLERGQESLALAGFATVLFRELGKGQGAG